MNISATCRFVILSLLTLLTACNGSNLNESSMMSLSDLTVSGDVACMGNEYHEDQVNEAKSLVLPVSLSRARELITDGAIPFGFSMPADFDREADFITNSALLVTLDKSHEPVIAVKLEPEKGEKATKIIVDTSSTHLVMKGRHHPFAGAILQHTACLYNLFDVYLSGGEKTDMTMAQIKDYGVLSVDLVLARSVSTQNVQLGERVPFIVHHDVRQNGRIIIGRGTRAWGKVTAMKAAGNFMKSGKLALELSHVDLPDGKNLPLRFQEIDRGEKNSSTGNKLAGSLTGGLMMVATVGLILPFIDGHQAVMRAGTEITVETAPPRRPQE